MVNNTNNNLLNKNGLDKNKPFLRDYDYKDDFPISNDNFDVKVNDSLVVDELQDNIEKILNEQTNKDDNKITLKEKNISKVPEYIMEDDIKGTKKHENIINDVNTKKKSNKSDYDLLQENSKDNNNLEIKDDYSYEYGYENDVTYSNTSNKRGAIIGGMLAGSAVVGAGVGVGVGAYTYNKNNKSSNNEDDISVENNHNAIIADNTDVKNNQNINNDNNDSKNQNIIDDTTTNKTNNNQVVDDTNNKINEDNNDDYIEESINNKQNINNSATNNEDKEKNSSSSSSISNPSIVTPGSTNEDNKKGQDTSKDKKTDESKSNESPINNANTSSQTVEEENNKNEESIKENYDEKNQTEDEPKKSNDKDKSQTNSDSKNESNVKQESSTKNEDESKTEVSQNSNIQSQSSNKQNDNNSKEETKENVVNPPVSIPDTEIKNEYQERKSNETSNDNTSSNNTASNYQSTNTQSENDNSSNDSIIKYTTPVNPVDEFFNNGQSDNNNVIKYTTPVNPVDAFFENGQSDNNTNKVEIPKEVMDFLTIREEVDQNGNVKYYDIEGNIISDEEYQRRYEAFLNTLDEDTRKDLEAYIKNQEEMGSGSYSTNSSNSLSVDYSYLEHSIKKIEEIRYTVNVAAKFVKNLKLPRCLYIKQGLFINAQSWVKSAIGTGEYGSAPNFLDQELTDLKKLKKLLVENDPNYEIMSDLYSLYSLSDFATGESEDGTIDPLELQKEAKEISDRLSNNINKMFRTYGENSREYDREFLQSTLDSLSQISKANTEIYKLYEDNTFWIVAQKYAKSLNDDSFEISNDELNFYNEIMSKNKDLYDKEMNDILSRANQDFNYALQNHYYLSEDAVLSKYNFMTDEEKAHLAIWANINLNECLVKAQPLEQHLIELDSATKRLEQLENDRLKYNTTPKTNGKYTQKIGTVSLPVDGKQYIERVNKYIDEYSSKISELTPICDSEASMLESLRNDISLYTEIGLEINYTNIIKKPEFERTDTDNDFLIHRQQYYYNKNINDYYKEIIEANKELEDINSKIEEIEKAAKGQSRKENFLNILSNIGLAISNSQSYSVSPAQMQSIVSYEEYANENPEYADLLAKRGSLESKINSNNSYIDTTKDLINECYTKYSDFNINNVNKIANYEITWEGLYRCAKFMDKDGNQIYPTKQEITVYMAQTGQNIGRAYLYSEYGGVNIFGETLNNSVNAEIKNMKYLDDFDKRLEILNYLDNVHGYNTFIKNYNDTVALGAQVEGKKIADKWLSNLSDNNAVKSLQVSLKGFGDGLLQYGTGIYNFLGGADGVVSARDYAIMYYSESLVKKYGGWGEILKATYEISTSTGNMLPTLVMSALSTYCPALAWLDTVSLSLMATSVAGNTMEQGLQQGMSRNDAFIYGIITGASEAFLEKILGGVLKTSFIKQWASNNLGNGAAYVVELISNFTEEALQDVLDPVYKYAITGQWDGVDWEGALKSGIYGMITAGLLNGAGTVVNTTASQVLTGNSNALNVIMKMHSKDAFMFNKSFINDCNLIKSSGDAYTSLFNQIKTDSKVIDSYNNYCANTEFESRMSFENYVETMTVNQILDISRSNPQLHELASKINDINNQIESLNNELSKTTDSNVKKDINNQIKSLNKELSLLNTDFSNIIKTVDMEIDVNKYLDSLNKVEIQTYTDKLFENNKLNIEMYNQLSECGEAGEQIKQLIDKNLGNVKSLEEANISNNLINQVKKRIIDVNSLNETILTDIQNIKGYKYRIYAIDNQLVNYTQLETMYNEKFINENVVTQEDIVTNTAKIEETINEQKIESIEKNKLLDDIISYNEQVNGIDLNTKNISMVEKYYSIMAGMLATFKAQLYSNFKVQSVESNTELFSQVLEEGLVHITTEDAAKAILKTGEVKASKGSHIYDSNKGYFFAGIPSYDQVCVNLDKMNHEKLIGVKIKPSASDLSDGSFNYRYANDYAIGHNGNYKFDSNNAELVYYGLDINSDGELYYKEITVDEYAHYKVDESKFNAYYPNIEKLLNSKINNFKEALISQYTLLKQNYNQANTVPVLAASVVGPSSSQIDILSIVKDEYTIDSMTAADFTNEVTLTQHIRNVFDSIAKLSNGIANYTVELKQELLGKLKILYNKVSTNLSNVSNTIKEQLNNLLNAISKFGQSIKDSMKNNTKSSTNIEINSRIAQINNLQNFVNQFTSNPNNFQSSFYGYYVKYNCEDFNVLPTREFLYNRYEKASNVKMFYWSRINGKFYTDRTNENGAFLNFNIGNETDTPFNNSYKIYVPVTDNSFTSTCTEVMDYLVQNNIASDNKIARVSRADAIVLRIFDVNDAINVMNFINNNPNIPNSTGGIPLAMNNGKASIAMDGHLSYNSVSTSLLEYYLRNYGDNNVYGFKQFVENVIYEVNYQQNLSTFINIFGPELANGQITASELTNYMQVIGLLDISLDENSNINEYFEYCYGNQNRDVVNRQIAYYQSTYNLGW